MRCWETNGNWGFLYDDSDETAEIAPVFDCGSCLLPQADENIMRKVLLQESELQARIYQFPTSAIKLKGRKINYYDFLNSSENKDCNGALLQIVPRIDLAQINTFIQSIPGISELQKVFYSRYVEARFDLILRPSFEFALAK